MFFSGIILFFGVHLIPLNTNLKGLLKTRLGEGPYLGLFSLVSLLGILLIILGYESNSNLIYSINGIFFQYSKYIMFISFSTLIAANFPTYIKTTTKHPMSLGIAIWSILHLLTNSDIKSVILFGSFLTYAVISVLIAELRNTEVEKSSPKIIFDALSIILGAILTILAYNFHGSLSGINLS